MIHGQIDTFWPSHLPSVDLVWLIYQLNWVKSAFHPFWTDLGIANLFVQFLYRNVVKEHTNPGNINGN